MSRDTIQRIMEKNVPHKFLKGHRDNHLRKLSRRKKKAKTKVRIIKNIEIGMQKQFKVDNIKAHKTDGMTEKI